MPRLVIALGKGSYVKVVGREGKQGKKMVILGTIGIQKDKTQVHNLDIANLVAIRALDESSDPDEDYMEELVAAACASGGVLTHAGALVCARAPGLVDAGVARVMRLLRQLYIQVLIGIVLAIVLGIANPHLAVAMKPLGDVFISLLR